MGSIISGDLLAPDSRIHYRLMHRKEMGLDWIGSAGVMHYSYYSIIGQRELSGMKEGTNS